MLYTYDMGHEIRNYSQMRDIIRDTILSFRADIFKKSCCSQMDETRPHIL